MLLTSPLIPAMPTGHFSIGDLSFSFEGDLAELAHCQELIREIDQAEQRLHRASGSDRVVLIYDRDLEGERGTFDKMRLRAYDEENNYTIDIGETDNNPLGIYVGYDQNIEVYNRESGETWQIDPEGNRIDSSEGKSSPEDRSGTSSRAETRRTAEPGSAREPEPLSTSPTPEEPESPSQAKEEGPSKAEIRSAAETLLDRTNRHPPAQEVGETTIPGGPLADKIRGFARYCGRDEGYLRRVLDVQGVGAVRELTVGQVPETIKMIVDDGKLHQNESTGPDDNLPF